MNTVLPSITSVEPGQFSYPSMRGLLKLRQQLDNQQEMKPDHAEKRKELQKQELRLKHTRLRLSKVSPCSVMSQTTELVPNLWKMRTSLICIRSLSILSQYLSKIKKHVPITL
jgi:hypothetical protein